MGKVLVAQAHRRPLAALLLICLLTWLPGFFTLPALDRDESRFAQAPKADARDGDFININLRRTAALRKARRHLLAPGGVDGGPGYRTAIRIWTYRLPSLLGALTAVLRRSFWSVVCRRRGGGSLPVSCSA